jgi:hypothetical protein
MCIDTLPVRNLMAKKIAMGSPMGQIIGGRALQSSTMLLLFCCGFFGDLCICRK